MKLIIVTLLIVLIFSRNVFASLKINEIYPNPQTGEKEWVEFYNSASSSADLSEYVFDDDSDFDFDSGNGDKILINGILPENSVCYWELNSYLNNDGDSPTLFKTDGIIIDTFSYTTTQKGKSYSRIPDGVDWQIDTNPTKASLNCFDLIPTLTPTPTVAPTEATGNLTPTSPAVVLTEAGPISYDNIYISEAMVNPMTGEKEWVEIYNNNDFSVSLSNWFIDDLENAGSSPKVFSLEITAKSYAIFDFSSSIFNNDGDSIRLLDFNKNLKDDFEYQKTETGKTLGRTSFDSDDFCLQEASKNSTNNPCINPTPTLIALVKTEQTNLSPAKNVIQTKTPTVKTNNFDVSIHRSINYPTGIVQKNYDNGDVLGLTNEIIINSPNNKSLINLLTILSTSYSLLVIISILIKSKVLNKYAMAS